MSRPWAKFSNRYRPDRPTWHRRAAPRDGRPDRPSAGSHAGRGRYAPALAHARLQFGDYELDLERRQLRHQGRQARARTDLDRRVADVHLGLATVAWQSADLAFLRAYAAQFLPNATRPNGTRTSPTPNGPRHRGTWSAS
ncbi:hypothetical protein [Micromonospora sp. NBC_01813]|uniref:hypothetical protein n=1 Tax=Micromonospora sp. NBC_01813 TaxID=2975988 RepID=UPI002DDA98E8|nr:hypothetical protein [Micromonospora sp. NBC_01813]WSA09968.1 hypothetical protein OG958_03955 [Micromonospora sp. NBC_01813]